MPAEQPASSKGCYHCGLPLDPAFDGRTEILGQSREFCCHGCLAVARSITDAGLESYYEHRRETAVTADVVPEIVRKLTFYDHPDVQQSFVRDSQNSREASLLLENIRCPACLWLNERVLRGLDGILDVELDYASHHARVRWDPDRIALSEILESIINIGYVAHPYDPGRRRQLTELQQRRSSERLIFAGVIGMVVMHFAIAGYVMGYSDETGDLALWVQIGRWTSLFAATVLLAYPGQEFFIGAWHDLRNRRLGMDIPIVLGLVTAYVGSLQTTITLQGEVYYDSIAMFVFLVLLARRIELRGRLRAADALDRVGRIQPQLARLSEPGGEREVLVTELQPGDKVRVLPGEVVPTDGILLDRASSFDESLLTGEPLPVTHEPGARLRGGSCNIEQPVEIEITHRSADSTLAEIHRLLSRGLRDAPRYAVLAERVASGFVAVVLLIGIVTAVSWLLIEPQEALRNTVAVLIVTCPCALALATPVAAAISAGNLADNGLLATHGRAIEVLAQADVVAFDKTGTLTTGALAVAEVATLDLDESRARLVAAALEQHSEHPVGRALRAMPPSTRLPSVDGLSHHVGQGISATVDGVEWRIGKRSFAIGDDPGDTIAAVHDRLLDESDTVIVLHSETAGTALFALQDQPRAGAERLTDSLRAQGVERVVLLSGDQDVSVQRFAAGRGFDEVRADMTPADKLHWIRQQQARGSRVIMVGDGINDAPTLAAADTSVSFSLATDLAQVNSDLLVLGDSLGVLADMRIMARRTRNIIRQNLSWAAAYNFLAVPFAALGYIAPWGAAIGMSASSLLVVLNALRLRTTK
ncbi:MAG: cadmium-translocating P-type ATPase [Gammaproteobacteria bacterium]|nr:cadmium-translocating P-type ATPase [Gammaproteobacteria bacterium]